MELAVIYYLIELYSKQMAFYLHSVNVENNDILQDVLEIIEGKPLSEPDHDDEDYQKFLQSLDQVGAGKDRELVNIETYHINIIAALVQKIHRH